MNEKTLLYFAWADDADPIPFRLNELGEWVVTGDSLLYMAKVSIGTYGQEHWQQPPADITEADPQTTISILKDLLAVYQPDTDTAILPDWFRTSMPITDAEGNEVGDDARLCDCGHLVSAHQTGEGPWSGFCGANLAECHCERPTIKGQEVE